MSPLARLLRSPRLIRSVAESRTPGQDAWLALRMFGWAVVLPVLKRIVPIGRLTGMMWKEGRPGRRDPVSEQQVVRLAGWLSRGTNLTKRGACLQQSLLAYRYLSALGANPRLMVAFRRSDRALGGHAWVVVDGLPIGEIETTLADFHPVVSFGERGLREPA